MKAQREAGAGIARPIADIRFGSNPAAANMQIRAGFEMEQQRPGPTPMIPARSIHPSRGSDPVRPDHPVASPALPVTAYRGLSGNRCSRSVAPPGRFVPGSDAPGHDNGQADGAAAGGVRTPGVRRDEGEAA